MEAIIENNGPRGSEHETNEATGGGALKALKLVIEIRRARQTIESQLKDIKHMAKSKIGALKRAEAILLDQQGEDEDQLILFSMDPDLDPEVQKIIDEPEI